MLDAGVYTSVTEISEAEAIGKSYVSRILRLALVAPDIVEGILALRSGRLQTHSVEGDRSAVRSGLSPAERPSAPPAFGRITEAATMTLRYAVGIKIRNKTDQVTVEAEDALIAALKVKTAHPEAAITYVRKQMPAAIDAIHTPARSIRNRPGAPHHARLSHSRHSSRSAGTIAEAMPDPVHKPPGRPPGKPIIIKNPPRPPEAPEIDGSLDEGDEAEIRTPPEIVPEKPPPPAPWKRPQGSAPAATTLLKPKLRQSDADALSV